MINENSMYVMKQPSHSVACMVVVQSLPLKEEEHEALDKLSSFTDLIFVFKNEREARIKKFCSLYNGCGYIENKKDGWISLVTALEYCQEIFKKHVGYLITRTDILGSVQNINPQKILEICGSDLRKPIFEPIRLSALELGEIYMQKKWFLEKENETRMYSTHRSNTPIMYFPAVTMKNILEQVTERYIKTFTEDDPSYFLASLTVHLGVEVSDYDITKQV